MRACVLACVRACVRACVLACVHVSAGNKPNRSKGRQQGTQQQRQQQRQQQGKPRKEAPMPLAASSAEVEAHAGARCDEEVAFAGAGDGVCVGKSVQRGMAKARVHDGVEKTGRDVDGVDGVSGQSRPLPVPSAPAQAGGRCGENGKALESLAARKPCGEGTTEAWDGVADDVGGGEWQSVGHRTSVGGRAKAKAKSSNGKGAPRNDCDGAVKIAPGGVPQHTGSVGVCGGPHLHSTCGEGAGGVRKGIHQGGQGRGSVSGVEGGGGWEFGGGRVLGDGPCHVRLPSSSPRAVALPGAASREGGGGSYGLGGIAAKVSTEGSGAATAVSTLGVATCAWGRGAPAVFRGTKCHSAAGGSGQQGMKSVGGEPLRRDGCSSLAQPELELKQEQQQAQNDAQCACAEMSAALASVSILLPELPYYSLCSALASFSLNPNF